MNNTLHFAGAISHIPPISWTSIATGVLLYCVVLVTIFGNVLVLVAVYANKTLQTTFNSYVVNLAITDFAVAVTAMSFHTTDNILGYWPFGEFLCGVWIFFDYGMTFVSVFTLILISLDRYWSVTWSNHYRLHHSKRKCVVSIACIWLFMLILWLPPCIYDRVHNAKPGECIWEPSLNKGFVIVVALIGHHGSCLIMLFCYIKVLIFMRTHRRVIASVSNSKAIPLDMRVSSIGNVGHEQGATIINVKEHQTALLTTPDSLRPENKERQTIVTNKDDECNKLTVNQNTCKAENGPPIVENPIKANPGNPIKTNKRSRVEKERRRKRERAIFITLTYVVIGYAVCWIPFHVVFDVSSVCPSCVPRGIYAVTFWMTYINSTINPFLYSVSNPEFKQTFKRLLRVSKR